jgi:hypothetical protein
VNALQQCVKGKAASCENGDFSVESEHVRFNAPECSDQFGKVTPKRLHRLGLEFNL